MIKYFSKIEFPFLKQGCMAIVLLLLSACLTAQVDPDGCVAAGFGVDAGLYANTLEFGTHGVPAAGTNDWFNAISGTGRGAIDESKTDSLKTVLQGGGNPAIVVRMKHALSSIVNGDIQIDALFGRDPFGGSGFRDGSAFLESAKNGEDPALWEAGFDNVLGKNDIIDYGAYMMRDGTTIMDSLWLFGLMTRAEPGGDAYVDFEFFVEEVFYNESTGRFNTAGPDIGHTAFHFDGGGNITSIGDMIFSVAFINGGIVPVFDIRIWVSRSDYNSISPPDFTWGGEYDGAFNGSPFGYASIIATPLEACAIVNKDGERPLAPPWGTLNTKENIWTTQYEPFSVFEIGINMTALGIDHASILGGDPCEFPIESFFVKTRTSASFTSALKDFTGPHVWAIPTANIIVDGDDIISCLNPIVTLSASPIRPDATYSWTTDDGNILGDPDQPTIKVDQPGTYQLEVLLEIGCPLPIVTVEVTQDLSKPLFEDPVVSTTVSCTGVEGSIDITINGGTAPFTFDWDYDGFEDPDNDPEDPVGLDSGVYTVVVTDVHGCTDTAMATIEPRIPATLSGIQADVDCFGEMTGSIDATVAGNGPFTYEWSTGEVTEDISGLGAGTYTLITSDADGCMDTLMVTISEFTEIVLTATPTDETDHTLDDGTVDLAVSGGTPPYSYDWDNDGLEDPDNDTEDLTGLAAGDYTVIVTDALGCTQTLTVTIYEPEICNDGIDNDNDGVADCFDDDCIPPTPGPITASDDTVCVGDMGVMYSIDPVIGATAYIWTVPSGATITAGQGTVSITVDWTGTNGGGICVTTESLGCLSASQSCITVEPDDVPMGSGGFGNQN